MTIPKDQGASRAAHPVLANMLTNANISNRVVRREVNTMKLGNTRTLYMLSCAGRRYTTWFSNCKTRHSTA